MITPPTLLPTLTRLPSAISVVSSSFLFLLFSKHHSPIHTFHVRTHAPRVILLRTITRSARALHILHQYTSNTFKQKGSYVVQYPHYCLHFYPPLCLYRTSTPQRIESFLFSLRSLVTRTIINVSATTLTHRERGTAMNVSK